MIKNKKSLLNLNIFLLLLLAPFYTIHADQTSANTYFNKAQKHSEQGDSKKAIELYQKALDTDPEHFEAHFYLANCFFSQGSYDKSAELFQKALEIKPHSQQAQFNLAVSFEALGKTSEAIDALEKTIQDSPSYLKAKIFLGNIFRTEKQFDKAIENYESALDLDPNNFDAQVSIADVYLRQKKFDESLKAYKKTVIIEPENLLSWFTIGCLQNKLGESEKAEETFRKLLEKHPNFIDAQGKLADSLRFLGRDDEAVKEYEYILEQRPENAWFHYGYAESLLKSGNLKKGLLEFEWRWKRDNDRRNFSEKLWDGQEDLNGKKILVRAEYGLGDTIQFSRFAKHLKDLGAIVIVEVQNALEKLFSYSPYIDEIITVKKSHTDFDFDFQVPVMSLPHKLGITEKENLSQDIPYIQADEELVKFWGSELARDGNFKIGICWEGSAYFDSFRGPLSKKTMHLCELAPLSQLPNVTLYSLQKSDAASQINEVSFEVRDLGPDFDQSNGRFMDTAALMKNLDLIVTVDTSVAHLAGALGVPVMVVLPTVADWRWMDNCDDTPWYPTMKLFRQKEYGNWNSVFVEIKNTIEKKLQDRVKKSDIVSAEISIGELIDKITILQLKNKYIKNEKKLVNVRKELEILCQTRDEKVAKCKELDDLTQQLYDANQRLWDIEDACRDKERVKEFDDEFIQITRSVYINNDQRCALKRKINTILGSNLVEEKSYAAY